MKLLLDTHALIWWANDDRRLSAKARRAVADMRNDALLSVVSAWEVIAKADRGLDLPVGPVEFIETQIREHNFGVTDLKLNHVLRLRTLPNLHADLFDRLLISQAMEEKAAIVTSDRQIGRYDVRVVW